MSLTVKKCDICNSNEARYTCWCFTCCNDHALCDKCLHDDSLQDHVFKPNVPLNSYDTSILEELK